jgi:predicted phage terminase large subunit-like protein
MQRLHEDDMSGFVLAGGMGEDFTHLKLKALDDNKALWPLKHSIEELRDMELKDRTNFATQYQQEPSPEKGDIFQAGWFARYTRLPLPPNRTMIVHSWDTAYKKGEHNDPSCCTVWHITPSLYYLAEVHHGKWDYPELRRRVINLADEQKPDAILIEDKASGQTLLQEMQTGSALPVIAIEPEGDKETRARTSAGSVQAGRVALPEAAAWLNDFEQEILNFPNSKHDDRVDSMSQFLNWMRERGGDSDTEFNRMMDRLYG